MLPELTEIKKRRKNLGITQLDLAKKSEVSQSLIAKLESGTLDPTYSKTKKIFFTLEKLESKESRKIKDIMNRKIIKLNSSDLVKSAIKKMKVNNVSQLPVFDGKNNIGSISDKTIMNSIASGEDIDIFVNNKVEDIMEDPFPHLNEDMDHKAAASILQYNQAILVLRKGKFVGIVSKYDLLK